MLRHRLVVLVSAFVLASSVLGAQAIDPGWTKLAPSPPLAARSAFAMAFDPVAGEMVVFGGDGPGGYSNRTWTFDGSAWTLRSTSLAPPARAGASMAFDPLSQRLVLFGGFDGAYLGDTWLWDGASASWSPASPTLLPTAVTGPSLFNDPVSGLVEQFGGFSGQFYHLDTYRWTGSDWQLLTPAHTPSARAAACVALDPTHGKVLLFGGLASVNPWNTWLWDGSDWLLQSPSIQPPNRYDGAAAWDAQLGGVLVFGGGSGGTDLRDTWEWTGGDWVKLIPSVSPPARESHGMAWDPALRRVLVVGGSKNTTTFADTWSFVEPGAFDAFGQGVGGAAGVPTLSGTGDLTPGSGLGFTLALTHAPPSALAIVLLGTSSAAAPFRGGTLYLQPILMHRAVTCDAGGSGSLLSAVPAGVPSGMQFFVQAWMLDPSAPAGLGATNGLRGTVP